MAKENPQQGNNVLFLILMLVIGFCVFSLIGFVTLIILLSTGILPAY